MWHLFCLIKSVNSLARNNCNRSTIFCNIRIAFEEYCKMNWQERSYFGKQVYARDQKSGKLLKIINKISYFQVFQTIGYSQQVYTYCRLYAIALRLSELQKRVLKCHLREKITLRFSETGPRIIGTRAEMESEILHRWKRQEPQQR